MLIFDRATFHHLPTPKTTLDLFFHYLLPGGVVFVAEFQSAGPLLVPSTCGFVGLRNEVFLFFFLTSRLGNRFYEPDEIGGIMTRIGYQDVDEIDLFTVCRFFAPICN